ncbi:hypothetical protein ACHAQA_009590 [Verticillium albo-atrum]
MSHLLWKHYWEHDVDKFRRLLAPAGYNTQLPTKSPGVGGTGSWGNSPGSYAAGTSPKATKSRKPSGFGLYPGGVKGSAASGLGKAEVNSRDHAGLTLLLRASSSTDPDAIRYVTALLDHPAIDLYVQDLESGWNALHRALYAGNISIARLLLDKERRILTEQTAGSAVAKVGQLIKTKDNEGNSPFDVYNSTIGTRNLKESGDLDSDDVASDSDISSDEDDFLARSVSALEGVTEGEEIFMFGSNKNLSLGVGDEDDRQYPERVVLKRPDHLLQRFYDDYLEKVKEDPGAPLSSSRDDSPSLDRIPALTKNRPLRIHDAVLSKFHTAILTTDPISNMYVCGVGRSGRLGLGDENTQFRFLPVQGGLADKKVAQVALGQSHTMALTDNGELWTWGSNGNSQLGYALPPARQDEEPVSATPRQVFGSLKKEVILGVAASAVHSVAHTATSLFCWGKNLGQLALMDADSRSLEVQATPRKVAVSLFSSNILAVSAIDKATTCLLEDGSVCVFTSYGYNFVKFPIPDVFANQQFTPRSMSSRYDMSRNSIKSITSGGDSIAALTTRGDVFTMALNHRAEAAPQATSTTNPAKIRGALTTPQCIWNARKDGAKSVGVGEHGSVIICTESGAVWRRIQRVKAKDTRLSGLAGKKRNDFKFQRVPSVTNAVAVRSSTFGAFAAIRKDCDVMREQIGIGGQTLWGDVSPLFALRGFQASESPGGHKDNSKLWDSGTLKERLGDLPYELLKSPNLDDDLQKFLRFLSHQHSEHDMLVSTTASPEIKIPVHGWILSARSSVLRGVFAKYRAFGEFEMPETLVMDEYDGKTLVTFQSLDLLAIVNLVVYCYDDAVVPAWNFTRQSPSQAFRYRQIRNELMKLATKLQMTKLEAAVRLQTGVERSLDQDMRIAIQDPDFFGDADAVVELEDDEVPVHSQLLRQRCAFFEGLFHGRSGGMWLAGRQHVLEEEDLIRVDLEHAEPEAFQYVLRHLYADTGVELFNDVVSSDLDDFSDLVVQVMSIANELMLDRLSQICQHVIGHFVNSRNIGLLLNEISPCSVTEFKDAGLEYVCLQMETMLENHHLDNLDEDLLIELDDVVRQNQLARYPFARSGRAERLLLENYPDLALDIEEERARRVKEMAFKAAGDERRTSTSFRTRFGSVEDMSGISPIQGMEKTRRKSKIGRNEPFSPMLRPKESHGDLMFDMDDEGPSISASPLRSPRQMSLSVRPHTDKGQVDGQAVSSSQPGSLLAAEAARSPTSVSPLGNATQSPFTPEPNKGTGHGKNASTNSPWGAAALSTSKLDLREMMTSTPPKSALSASLAAQKTKEASPRASQPKLSQKERKKQQQAQAAAQAAQELEMRQPKAAWDPESSASKAAPWKAVESGPKTSLKDALASEPVAKPTPPTAVSKPKPLVAAETTPSKSIRRTASPDTRFSGQSRVNSSPAVPAASAARSSPKPLVPHSKSYMPSARKTESFLGLGMEDIIVQQRLEQEAVRDAVAKRSMQEIQQEQEFQQWWDLESRRIQLEEESRQSPRDKARDKGRDEKDKDKDKAASRGGKRGRRGRSGKGGGDGPVDQGEGGGEGSSAPKTVGASSKSRGRGGRGRGGKAATTTTA